MNTCDQLKKNSDTGAREPNYFSHTYWNTRM